MSARLEPLRGAAVLAVLVVSGCAGERDPMSPATAEEAQAASDEPMPASEAEAEPMPSPDVEALASVEAELAAYESQLAKAGVRVARGAARPATGASKREQTEGGAPRPYEPVDATAAAPNAQGMGGVEAAKPSKKAETKTASPARDNRRKEKRKGGGKSTSKALDDELRNDDLAKDGDGDAQPAPPAGVLGGGDVAGSALAEEATPEQEASRLDPKPRCEQLCSLSDAICALETRVCTLAEDHEWDQRYADACTRATEDCTAARTACESCEP